MRDYSNLHSFFGRAVVPHSFDRLSDNPGVLLRDAKREQSKRLRLAGTLISPFDVPERNEITAAQECWLKTAIAIALAAKQHEELPASAWIYADGRIVPAEFEASWLALRKRAQLSVEVSVGYRAADLGAWLAQYPTERACMDRIEAVVWPDGPACIHCGRTAVARMPRAMLTMWWCGSCRREFSALKLLGINAHWPLRCWFAASFLSLAGERHYGLIARANGLEPSQVWSVVHGGRGLASTFTDAQWDRLAAVIVEGKAPGLAGVRVPSGGKTKADAPVFTLFEPPPPPEVPGLGKRNTRSAEELRAISMKAQATKAARRARGELVNPGGRPRRHEATA